MGVQKDIKFVGTVNGIIYYVVNDQYLIRTKPEYVEQTPASQASANVFGNASTMGSLQRNALFGLIPNAQDKKMQNRLTTAFQYFTYRQQGRVFCIQPVTDTLESFAFNTLARSNTHLRKLAKSTLVAGEGVDLRIKAFNPVKLFHVPGNLLSVRFLIAVTVLDINHKQVKDSRILAGEMAYTDKEIGAQQMILPVEAGPGNIVTAAVAVQFCTSVQQGAAPLQNLRYLPAILTGAWWL